ncbi:hypothetical protein BHYA_0022g00300 [Botrytis hyacinthi]|uniref:2EXR domain-containing protein n=1 Tax=Botrytis hyacinthi TaxID=278943 RepID=A0A4Z1H177_9HELO|nr:hypothetical protein BHYA_0022g00300 [Botrytis hyacinthi]
MSFSMLPAELRAMIWEFSLPKPGSHIVKTNQMTKKKKIPVLFQINYESREFALKHMPLLFDGTNIAGCDDSYFNHFNPKINTLCLYDMDENVTFFMGPRYYPRRNDIEFPESAPIKECDIVKSIEFKGWTSNKKSLLRKNRIFSKPPKTSPDQKNAIIHLMTSLAEDYYRFFSLRVTRREIAAIPDIVFIITKADARFIFSTSVSTLEFSGTRTVMNKAVENRLKR